MKVFVKNIRKNKTKMKKEKKITTYKIKFKNSCKKSMVI